MSASSFFRRRGVRILLGLFVVVLVAAVAIPMLVPAEKWQQLAFDQLEARTGLVGSAQSAKLSIFPLGLRMSELELSDPSGRAEWTRFEVAMDAVVVRADLASIFRGQPQVQEVRLVRPDVVVHLAPAETTEAAAGASAEVSAALAMLSIDDGAIEFVDPAGVKYVMASLNNRASLALSGGAVDGDLDGTLGRIEISGGDIQEPVALENLRWKAKLHALVDGSQVDLDLEETGLPGADLAGRIAMNGDAAELTLDGRFALGSFWEGPLAPFAGPSLVEAGLTDQDFAVLGGSGRAKLSYQGSLSATPDEMLAAIRVEGRVESAKLRTLGREDLFTLDSDFRVEDGRLRFDEGVSRGAIGEIAFSGAMPLVGEPVLEARLAGDLESKNVRATLAAVWSRLAAIGEFPVEPGPETWPNLSGVVATTVTLAYPLGPGFDPVTGDEEAVQWQLRARELRVGVVELVEPLVFRDVRAKGTAQRAEITEGRVVGPGFDLLPTLTVTGWPERNRVTGEVEGASFDFDAFTAGLAQTQETAWWSDVLVDVAHAAPGAEIVAPPEDLELDIDVALAKVLSAGYTLENATGHVALAGQKLALEDLEAKLGGGDIVATGGVDWTVDPPRWAGGAQATAVPASSLLSPVAPVLATALQSNFNGSVDLDGPLSALPEEMRSSLTGNADLIGAAGKILTEPLLGDKVARFLGSKAQQWQSLDFTDLAAHLRVEAGRVHFDEMVLRGSTRVKAIGSIGLDGSCDYRLDVLLPEGVTPELGALAPVADLLRDADGRFTFGVDVRGPAAKPSVEIDYGQLENRARVAGEGKLRDELEGRLGDLIGGKGAADSNAVKSVDELKSKAEEGLKGLLEGIGKKKKGGGGSP